MANSLRARVVAASAGLVLLLAGCSAQGTQGTTPTASVTSVPATAAVPSALFDAGAVHTIAVDADQATLTGMIRTYLDSGEKEWIKATVTIDGRTFADVGIKLKGNSSLRGITTDTPAQELPLRIRLDKYVDDQNIDGYADVTVRANNSETSLNEAVSLDLLRDAGLASEKAIATRFSVNGSAEVLRLTVQNLDDTWLAENFPDAGKDSVLYKAEAEGDWSWRGKDGDYTTSFEIEAGADDYAPLVSLLDLLNNGTAAQIARKLPGLLDIDSLAQYLAFEEFVDNFDDIDGPGNNSYLLWDSKTRKFTVVAWDHNLTFGLRAGGGGAPGGGVPGGGGSGRPPGGGGGGGGGGAPNRSNPLTTAFRANTTWTALYNTRLDALTADLAGSGRLTAAVDAWVATLTAGASDLVDAATLTTEADAIRAYAR
ncbi:MAG: CotH kinase family protein [Actinobacteria bacterium]|nr:CotH kinase family protein [Actinomycetota bacterium]